MNYYNNKNIIIWNDGDRKGRVKEWIPCLATETEWKGEAIAIYEMILILYWLHLFTSSSSSLQPSVHFSLSSVHCIALHRSDPDRNVRGRALWSWSRPSVSSYFFYPVYFLIICFIQNLDHSFFQSGFRWSFFSSTTSRFILTIGYTICHEFRILFLIAIRYIASKNIIVS